MKHLILIMGLFLSSVAFSQSSESDEKKQREGNPSEGVKLAVVAQEIANYGYSNNNPLSLISAADILVDNPTTELKPEKVESNEKGNTKTSKESKLVKLDVKELLKDARKMANGNTSLLAIADNVEKRIAATTKSAVGGAKYTLESVSANSTDIFYIRFYGGELAEVALKGDGDTDLDLYIYDENGNLIDSDTGYSDACYASWQPKWTGTFKIKVKNRGDIYNEYALITN